MTKRYNVSITCGQDGFNVADIRRDGYDMPPILPDKTKCILGDKCTPVLGMRMDDNIETINARFLSYDQETVPLVAFYKNLGLLEDFEIKRGISDWPSILQLMNSPNFISKSSSKLRFL